MKLAFVLIAAFLSVPFISSGTPNNQESSKNKLQVISTVTPKPTTAGGPGPGPDCTLCLPDQFDPEKKIKKPLIRPTGEIPEFKAFSEFRRTSNDVQTEFLLKIEGLDKTKTYFVYTIDKDGKVTKIDSIEAGKTKVEAQTELKSFIIAVSADGNIQQFEPDKFVLINAPAESFTKLRQTLKENGTIKLNQ